MALMMNLISTIYPQFIDIDRLSSSSSSPPLELAEGSGHSRLRAVIGGQYSEQIGFSTFPKLRGMMNNELTLMRDSGHFVIADEDRISELPDEILCCILSFLTIKEAGRTIALSKRWKITWTMFVSLIFTL
ncbi:OLC1v1027520C1 [Oldenlandia corymbosa var. corymbosa]|uniref:OLC1v1027520C1 n=1 Tax=Oldenlandia corymbosa var. corymbosa TaxID=529605 RepID=A0AAV1C9P8_OLDCO|nr:OLC1v1027520C1 [Oldenlandia corymbosa var. corymbosa]